MSAVKLSLRSKLRLSLLKRALHSSSIATYILLGTTHSYNEMLCCLLARKQMYLPYCAGKALYSQIVKLASLLVSLFFYSYIAI